MNSKFLRIALSFATVLAMSGCSVDDLTGGDDDDSPSISDPDKVELAAEYSECVGEYGPYTEKMGADGKFQVICDGGFPEIAFANGVTSLTVTQAVSEEVFEMKSADFDIDAEVTIDAKAGTQHIVGKHSKEGSVDCTYKFESQLPLTLNSMADIDDKLDVDEWPEISNDCPAWMNEDDDDDDWNPTSFTSVENITITDSDGDKSNITLYQSIEK